MALFLTKEELQSERFVEDKMFTCIIQEGQEPTERFYGIDVQEFGDACWEIGTYASKDIENGIELDLRCSRTLINRIFPFVVNLFNTELPKAEERGFVSAFTVLIDIKTKERMKS